MTFVESDIFLGINKKCLTKFQATTFSVLVVYLKGIVLVYMSHKHSTIVFMLSPATVSSLSFASESLAPCRSNSRTLRFSFNQCYNGSFWQTLCSKLRQPQIFKY